MSSCDRVIRPLLGTFRGMPSKLLSGAQFPSSYPLCSSTRGISIMGGWKLEVSKMAVYMIFPVGTFFLFNQPQLFEEWVIKMKREVYPPENPDHRRLLEETIANINKKQDVQMLRALEEKH